MAETARRHFTGQRIVIEHRNGSVSAVEIKSAATVHRDVRGLNHLKEWTEPRGG